MSWVKMERAVDVNLLKRELRLDKKTGQLYWRKGGPGKRPNRLAGSRRADGRRQIRVLGKIHLSSRVVFALAYGRWPNGFVDHINCDPADDRPCNLRDATHAQNRVNTKARGQHGLKGVRKSGGGMWHAKITHNDKPRHLGSYLTKEEANAAYMGAAWFLYGKFARRM